MHHSIHRARGITTYIYYTTIYFKAQRKDMWLGASVLVSPLVKKIKLPSYTAIRLLAHSVQCRGWLVFSNRQTPVAACNWLYGILTYISTTYVYIHNVLLPWVTPPLSGFNHLYGLHAVVLGFRPSIWLPVHLFGLLFPVSGNVLVFIV